MVGVSVGDGCFRARKGGGGGGGRGIEVSSESVPFRAQMGRPV